jgi:hypothetical protein
VGSDIGFCGLLFSLPSYRTTDEEGTDLFYADIAAPQAITENNLGMQFTLRSIVANPFSWLRVLPAVQERLESCEGENWSQQSEQLSKHFHWEYANY